jgi:hypothetical protein
MNYFRMRSTGKIVTEEEYRTNHDKVFPQVFVPEDADPILESPTPTITEHQRCFKNGVKQDALLNWVWDWDTENFSSQEIAEYEAKKTAETQAVKDRKIDALWNAANAYVTGYISGVAIGILTIGLIQQKPKAQAVSQWSQNIWTEYYKRKAAITASSAPEHDFTSFGPIPFTVPQLQAEVGL